VGGQVRIPVRYNANSAFEEAKSHGALHMKISIIQPTHFKSRSNPKLHRTKKRDLVGLALPYLAALTPREWDVELIDQQLSDIDFDAPTDLVAITTWTLNSLAAYDVADRFRARGVPVIMGGPHSYFFSGEMAQHCDAVGVGEGEVIWPRMLEDAAGGRLQKIYKAELPHHLSGLPSPRYNLVDFRRFSRFKTFAVQTSRGCPFRCDFCAERFYLGRTYRFRPVSEVVEEIKESRAKYILFADSTFAGKKKHTMELMQALLPLGIRWSALWSSNLCRDREFMDLAKRSGLLHVNIGMESIDQATLTSMNKRTNKVRHYDELIKNLHARGISFSLNFVLGYDTDHPNIFDSTMDFLKKHEVPVAYFNILTPHKGTPLYDRLSSEGRLINHDEISRWPGTICYFNPRHFSPQELEARIAGMYRQFYSLKSILSRLRFPTSLSDLASWTVNLSQLKLSRATGVENFENY